jgi:acyl-CoA reductase-like NAD-dependent aldehyde dehydrogenase
MNFDKDLSARQEARDLSAQAASAQRILAELTQEKLDSIVEAVAKAFSRQAPTLARMAVEETGFGNTEDKTTKNCFASDTVAQAIRGMKTVGLLREDRKNKLWEIGVPMGAIAAIVPSTNPTSTVCYKALIALKAGCSIVFSPHPKAIAATRQAAKIVAESAEAAGAPKGSVSCLSIPSLQGCQELMASPHIRLILPTGIPVRAETAQATSAPVTVLGRRLSPERAEIFCILSRSSAARSKRLSRTASCNSCSRSTLELLRMDCSSIRA